MAPPCESRPYHDALPLKTSLSWARLSQMSRLSAPCSETCLVFFEDLAVLRAFADLSELSDLADLPEDALSDLSEEADFFDFSDLAVRDSDFWDFLEAAEADTPEEVLSEGELAEAASAFMGAVSNIHATATASMEGQREYFMIIPWLLFEAVRLCGRITPVILTLETSDDGRCALRPEPVSLNQGVPFLGAKNIQ